MCQLEHNAATKLADVSRCDSQLAITPDSLRTRGWRTHTPSGAGGQRRQVVQECDIQAR